MLSLVFTLVLAASPGEVAEPVAPTPPTVPTAEVAKPAADKAVPAAVTNGMGGAAAKPAAKPVAPLDAEHDPSRISPPALGPAALCEELRRADKSRAAEDAEMAKRKEELVKERARLEAMQQDIAKARAQLKAETAKLEALIKKGKVTAAKEPETPKPEPKPETTKVTQPLEKASLEGIAKAMHTMKPAEGAQLLAKLDRTLASEVLRRMKPADAGAVMEKLRPELAAELVSMMAVTSANKDVRP